MNTGAVRLTLDLLALLGAGAYVFGQIGWRRPTPVSIRLTALLLLLMVLVAMRIAHTTLPFLWMVRIEEAVAAFVPLFALVLAEGMMRRHAPGAVKLALAVGSTAVATGALLRPLEAQAGFATVLGIYLIGALLAVCIVLAARRRTSLSLGENSAISAFFCGVLFALPFGATDFLATMQVIPAGVGSLALLVFLFFASHVTVEGSGGLAAISEFAWAVIASIVTYGALGFVSGWPDEMDGIQLAAIILALLLTFRIVQYVREHRKARARQTLWQAFARAPVNNLEMFLDMILSAEEFEKAQLLQGPALADYDHDRLRRLFADTPVISAGDVRQQSASELQQLDVIFDQHEATHAVLVRKTPLALLLVNMPRVGAGVDAEVQLAVLAKLATQIAPPHA
ncbi:MAG TPA: hypothetical protein VGO52_22780 [Hyphomonadaceae bacterium]|nr:hypothetical protein [Hyphomonadaceae bacterium]